MKILTEFTNFIRPLIPDILQSYEFLAEIDFIRAKALFAEQINGIKPVIEDKQQIDWIHAAHPAFPLVTETKQADCPVGYSPGREKTPADYLRAERRW